MSILIACCCVVTTGAEKCLTSADLCCFAYTSHFCFNPLLLNQTFQGFQFHPQVTSKNQEFFGVESRTENDQDFSKKSQSELVKNSCFWCPWMQELLNIWEIHMLHTLWERPQERRVQMRLKSFWGQKCMAFFYECVVHDHVSVSLVSTCAWGRAIRILKSEAQVFAKGLKKNCHLLTINLSALP